MRTSEFSNATPGDPYVKEREAMVENQIRRRGLKNERVLRAMATIPRHEFVLPGSRGMAYADEPLGIGGGQTISQPYIVAAMTAALDLQGCVRVLEVGAGSGYQAAVLSLLAGEVFTVEFRCELAGAAAERLKHLGYANVHVHCGDGTLGLKEFAPFDAILLAAVAELLEQGVGNSRRGGGRLIAPVGTDTLQQLLLITRHGDQYSSQRRENCRFVPLIGRHGWKPWESL